MNNSSIKAVCITTAEKLLENKELLFLFENTEVVISIVDEERFNKILNIEKEEGKNNN